MDIGVGSIKMVELEKGKQGIKLTRADLIEVSPDNGKSEGKRKVQEALEKVLAGGIAKGKTVSIATAGPSVYIRYVKLPPVDATRVERIIRYEAQQQIPLPLNEVLWDYQILKGKEAAEIKVVLVAMKSELVRELLRELVAFRIEPDIVDYSPLAYYNCLKFNQELSDEEASLLINMGAKSTDLSIEREGSLCWTRSIPLGGNDFTRAVQQSLKLSFAEAEKLKREEGRAVLENEEENEISLAINPILSRLVNDIERSLTFFRAELRGTAIARVLLSGGGAKLANLNKFLERELGIEVREASPLKNITLSNDFPFSGRESSFSVAIGLALRPLTGCASEVTLLPLEIAKKKEFQRKKGDLILSFVLALSIAVTAYAFAVQDYTLGKKRLEAIQKELAEYQKYEQPIKRLRGEIGVVAGRLAALRDLTEGKTFWLEVLLELSRVIPDEIKLNSLFQREGILILEGEALTIPYITDFVSELESSPLFGEVEVDTPGRQSTGEFYQFSLQVPMESFPFAGRELGGGGRTYERREPQRREPSRPRGRRRSGSESPF